MYEVARIYIVVLQVMAPSSLASRYQHFRKTSASFFGVVIGQVGEWVVYVGMLWNVDQGKLEDWLVRVRCRQEAMVP